MNDINLLPDDLRSEEGHQAVRSERGQSSREATSFYIPENGQKTADKPAQPAKNTESQPPRTSAQPPASQKAAAIPVTVKKPAPAAPPQELGAKKRGLFGSLFGKKNKSASAQPVLNTDDFSGDDFDVNLIPEGAHLAPLSKFTPGFILSLLAGLFLLALGFLAVNLYQQKINQQQGILSNKLAAGELQYQQLKVKETEIKQFIEQIAAVSAVLDRHVYWSNFFKELEQITLPEVYFSSITFSLDGYATLSSISDSYPSVARQWKVYENAVGDVLKEFAISGLNGEQNSGKISFTTSLLLKPEVYFTHLPIVEELPAPQVEELGPSLDAPPLP
jgi:hypothetical protein